MSEYMSAADAEKYMEALFSRILYETDQLSAELHETGRATRDRVAGELTGFEWMVISLAASQLLATAVSEASPKTAEELLSHVQDVVREVSKQQVLQASERAGSGAKFRD